MTGNHFSDYLLKISHCIPGQSTQAGHTVTHTLPRSKASMAKTARSLVFQRSRLSSNSTRAGPGRLSRLGHYELDKTKLLKSGLESGMMSLSPSFNTTASLESANSFSFSLHFGPDPSQAPGPKPPCNSAIDGCLQVTPKPFSCCKPVLQDHNFFLRGNPSAMNKNPFLGTWKQSRAAPATSVEKLVGIYSPFDPARTLK